MTKREFERATKHDHGETMASDEREDYRRSRLKGDWDKGDYVERRARQVAERRARGAEVDPRNPTPSTFSPSQQWREIAKHRARFHLGMM